MSFRFEAPSHEALVAEQAAVQAEKFQGQLLNEYSQLIFPGQEFREPLSCAVTDFLAPPPQTERVSLVGILQDMYAAKGRPVHWADMGAGRALAMRQLAVRPEVAGKLVMTAVDLIDFDLDGLVPGELKYIEEVSPGATDAHAKPPLVWANVFMVVVMGLVKGKLVFGHTIASVAGY